MTDAMTYKVAPVESIGWMSEAHRLSLGANRSRKGPTKARNSNRSSEIALATRPRIRLARASILQPAIVWLSTLKIGSGAQRSTT